MLLFLSLAILIGKTYSKFTGTTGEYHGLPVNVYCNVKFGYIKLGGINVNNVPLALPDQLSAEKECDDQYELMEEAKKDPRKIMKMKGSMCSLTLAGVNMTSDDIVRIVYSCLHSKPSKDSPHLWYKENNFDIHTARAEKNKSLKLQCNLKEEMIFIQTVKLIGEENVVKLDKVKKTQICFQQMKERIDREKSETNPAMTGSSCTLLNTHNSPMVVKYVCLLPGEGNNTPGSFGNYDEREEEEEEEEGEEGKK